MSPSKQRLASLVVALALGACNSPAGSTTSQPAGGGSSQGAGAGGGSGAGAATLNPCTMLSAGDIQTATGWMVGAGQLQTTDSQSDCQWADAADDSHAVGVTIADFDDTIWQAGVSSSYAKPVSGLGDAAFEGWPTANALSIKVKGYEVTVGIIDFAKTNDEIHAADETLANIVLPKL
jgi:hypothetical protein